MVQSYQGWVTADICEIRFAFSGKVAGVGKKVGDTVKQWEWIASLDKKVLQMELDLELADYEKVRAEFEIFTIKNGQGGDDVTKFLRQTKQSALNASVKKVELAKYKLDQGNIASPVAGSIIDMEGLVVGVNVTPASAPVKIVDRASMRCMFTVNQQDVAYFMEPRSVKMTFAHVKKVYTGTSLVPGQGKNGTFPILVRLDDSNDLLPGMKGKVTF